METDCGRVRLNHGIELHARIILLASPVQVEPAHDCADASSALLRRNLEACCGNMGAWTRTVLPHLGRAEHAASRTQGRGTSRGDGSVPIADVLRDMGSISYSLRFCIKGRSWTHDRV